MNERTRPVLFLDVAGVINAEDPKSLPSYERTIAAGWSIQYRPAVVDRVNRLSRTGTAEVVWLMTTLDSKHLQALREALRFERFLALPHGEEMLWAVVGAPWWKVQTILGHLAEHSTSRPWAWVDDEIDTNLRQFSSDGPHLLVRTDPRRGLTDKEMESIDAWLGAHDGREGHRAWMTARSAVEAIHDELAAGDEVMALRMAVQGLDHLRALESPEDVAEWTADRERWGPGAGTPSGGPWRAGRSSSSGTRSRPGARTSIRCRSRGSSRAWPHGASG
ncbi:HAD domain-containing protein [Georgenia sp. SUBG003]|uniref:HAD domain-containing protein n=1 Tax=Georgenia sp. SUBG003 TaxID=1497974 RepID=UPI0004D7BCE8|nr:hypothetical protein DA06_16915 [Georgenia sp. SUBG003]